MLLCLVCRGRADAATFKSKWIIHFINEQGLDEAGVDEQGLFREFVEVSCQKIFDPDMNLFARTEEQRMYPCSESQLGGSVSQEHLNLFHLAGRLFGRTVFEGIVADLPFANFFLCKLLHGHAFLDDLQSLDPALYKNLIFVKHYEGDVEDLCLTLAVDEEVFGQSTTVDLEPGCASLPFASTCSIHYILRVCLPARRSSAVGQSAGSVHVDASCESQTLHGDGCLRRGRASTVTNQNRTHYVHLMARYYMNDRISKQSRAFATGFKEIIPDRWLRIFSTPAQLQRLVRARLLDLELEDDLGPGSAFRGSADSHRSFDPLGC